MPFYRILFIRLRHSEAASVFYELGRFQPNVEDNYWHSATATTEESNMLMTHGVMDRQDLHTDDARIERT